MRLLRAAHRAAIAWKNGGGMTREVAAYPPGAGMDDFGWRVSIADVAASGVFSCFEGVDRILTILEGRLSLRFAKEERVVTLGAGQPFAFPGDDPVDGAPVGGPVRDLNVMVRRGAWRAQVDLWRLGLDADATRIALATEPSPTFDVHDALLLDPGEALPGEFSGYLIRFDPLI
jgi:environmental stress-induced protein Ves